MTSPIVLHIGRGKSGSSALQHMLAANVDRLREHGLNYTTVGRSSGVNHQALPIAITNPAADEEEVWEPLRREVYQSDETTVISAEAFEGVEPRAVRNLLPGVPVKVVCYARPQAALVPSFYTQNTKFGLNTDDFDALYDREVLNNPRQWRLGAFIRPWVETFGIDAVRFRSLHPEVLEGGDLVTDFLAACGAKVDDLTPVVADDFANESPGWKLVESLRGLHGPVASSGSAVERMRDPALWPYLQRAFHVGSEVAADLAWNERGNYLSADQANQLAGFYDEDRREVESLGIDARLHSDAALAKSREFLPGPEMVPAEERAEFLSRVAPPLLAYLLRR